MSRKAAQNNVSFDKTAEVNARLIQEVLQVDTVEEINLIATRAFDFYIKAIQTEKDKPGNGSVNEIVKYIHKHYKENLTLEEIANNVFLSTSYASRIFKKVQGVSIVEYIANVRIDEAKKLLANPHYQIDEIANSVGYTDASYFTKVFRKYSRMTPSQYRQSIQR
jgi:YesN/AraC family two-component response regulator